MATKFSERLKKIQSEKYERKGFDYVFTFGKHRGRKAESVIVTDPGYCTWVDRKGIVRFSTEVLFSDEKGGEGNGRNIQEAFDPTW